ncbi:hypothetical protein [Thalassovita mangrovi]|uniref:hypothetical protein n=1 Tax=Thalassovita mangrovi TaxID=2692236 RepID=UPI001371259B|nr:hypothetical protein [Thalassovita mangrovi]
MKAQSREKGLACALSGLSVLLIFRVNNLFIFAQPGRPGLFLLKIWRIIMKKFALATTIALSATAAVPAFAEEAQSDDPFLATQGMATGSLSGAGLAAVLVAAAAVIAVAASGGTTE